MGKSKEEIKAYKAEYYKKNRERIRAHQNKTRKTKSDSGYSPNRKSNLKQKFGLTVEDYEKMLADQNGVCAICGRGEVISYQGRIRDLSVDHCHKTGKVRKLLCSTCNNGLGCFKDDPNIIREAIKYLQYHKEEKE